MDKIKKAYVDSRFRTRDSNPDSDFKFGLKEPLDFSDNTVCYVDDISIPHTWRTVESHSNEFYIIFKYMYLAGGGYEITEEHNCNPYVLTLPEGNYTGPQLAPAIQELLNNFAVTFDFEVVYQPARGCITIETKSEGMDEHNNILYTQWFWNNNMDEQYR